MHTPIWRLKHSSPVSTVLITRLEFCHGELFIICKPQEERIGWNIPTNSLPKLRFARAVMFQMH